ncbi:MAG: tRNA pseudouridine(38-40) synthase TruA [Chlamydiia bacterium]
MQRYKILIAYDGTPYSGFQRQINGTTVQGCIEKALKVLEPLPVTLFGASRTDAGVHALGQVAHFDLTIPRDPQAINRALNAHLPREIRVTHTLEVRDDFHARFHAKKKIYTYTLSTTKYQSPFLRFHTLHYPYPLDLNLIDQAISILIGTHDFAHFANTAPKKPVPINTIRTLYDIHYKLEAETLTFFFIGNSFLYNMVRNLIGALLEVGQKRLSLETLASLLHTKLPLRPFNTMPPHALCLQEIFY